MIDKNKDAKDKAQPSTLAQVIKASEGILRIAGVEGADKVSATVPLESSELTEVPTNTTPDVIINRPTGAHNRSSDWSYEIRYGTQDPTTSRHVLVMGGEIPYARISFADGTPSRPITDTEAQAVVADLTRITLSE